MHKLRRNITLLLLLLLLSHLLIAQDVDKELEYRSGIDLSYKLDKMWKISFVPEIRYDDSFSPDKYLFEGGLTYKPVKFLAFEGNYRYVVNPRTTKETEYFNQYALSLKGEKEFGRFNSELKIRYTNDADDEITDEEFMRYKFLLDYNIPNCKFTPEIAMEVFQQLGNDGGMYKMRYVIGVNYKLFKNNYLEIAYKFDYHYTQLLNKHIVGLAYKIKF
jgi:hypothetical protein